MKNVQRLVLLSALLCGALVASACGSNASGGGGGSTGGGSTAAPTATLKPKPTALPKITMAFCQGIMTVAEANQIMHPPTPATTIRIDAPSTGGGSCNYEYAKFKSVLTVTFLPFKGGPSDVQPALAAAAAQLAQVKEAKITTTPVSVGDGALFVTVVLNAPPISMYEAAVDAIYGHVAISCVNFNVGSASFAPQQTALTQACQQVVSRV